VLDDPQEMDRRGDYADRVRAIGRRTRIVGFILCLVGVMILVWARFRGPGALSAIGIAGLVTIAAGWGLFVYVLVARTRYVRRDPYKSEP
jgi:hypothetical protein